MVLEAQIDEASAKMRKAVTAAQEDFAVIRTGRASPHLLDRIQVDYYGTMTPLQQIAGISVPEARMLVVSPYDKNSMSAIEKAIQTSDLGVNPNSDGTVIRLVFPPLTEERRKVLIKQVKERAEEGRIAIRNVRRHAKSEMERLERDGEVSEDDLRRSETELQRVTDRYVEEIDTMTQHKETELLEV